MEDLESGLSEHQVQRLPQVHQVYQLLQVTQVHGVNQVNQAHLGKVKALSLASPNTKYNG